MAWEKRVHGMSVAEQYKVPEGVDSSFEAMTARLRALQPSLKDLMSKALALFDDVYPQAPHLSEVEDPRIVYAVHTADVCPVERVPKGRELTVVLGAHRWVRVFRNTDSCPDAYPRQRLWYTRPEDEVHRRVNVLRTHDPRRERYPYDVETVDYNDKSICQGFVNGAAYIGQEPYIEEASRALDEARQIADENGFLIVSRS